MSFTLKKKTPRISLSCKLVPVYYQEHETGPLGKEANGEI